MDLAEFTHWVNQSLEGANFSPEYPAHEQVVFLPMSQMLARPFPAVVLAGCDEVRLNPSPEPPGGWTVQQRAALGLPSREELQAVASAAWLHALQTPVCDVLWRCSDDAGETLLPSALVQRVQLERADSLKAGDPRQMQVVAATPVHPPKPDGHLLPVKSLSASAYEDLRTCPYRFFAMRQLGLRSVDELDAVVDKRDFGVWLHEVLKRFHEALTALNQPGDDTKRSLLDDASVATTQSMGLADGEFLPFAAAWPAVREGYLRWLARHQAGGASFATAETDHSQRVGPVTLVGRIDRTDTLPGGEVLVLDYKTENAAKTASRVKEPLEDTQIAFYAALLPNDTLHGAYVNVGERDGTKAYAQADIVEARDALIAGVLHDMERIGEGAPMPALGEGTACDFCQARGLCRKDFWI
jgi:ATP-dependent helicase/nuclease subunit B